MESGRTVPLDAAATALTPTGARVEVQRSRRRTRTVSAYRDGDAIIVQIPARLSKREEREWVATMVARIERAEQRRRPTDDALAARARQLSEEFLAGRAAPTSVRWVSNQHARWGSCTPSDRTIRLSDRMRDMPAYVVDYVLLHELAHLLVPGHNDDFWALVSRYDRAERARGYLEGVSAARQLALQPAEASTVAAGGPDDGADPDPAGGADDVGAVQQHLAGDTDRLTHTVDGRLF